MRRIATLGLAAALLLALAATPAQAAVKEVNAGVNAVAWDEEFVWDGQHYAQCDVQTFNWGSDPRVELACDGAEGYGTAWVRVRVPGITGKVTGVRAELTGECTNNRNVSWKKRRSKVLVTVSIHADAACTVRAIRVSYS